MQAVQSADYGWDPQRLLLFDTLLAMTTLYIMIEMGLTAFIDETHVTITLVMYWMDVVSVALLLVGFLVEFRRGYREKGRLVTDKPSVLKNYHWFRILMDCMVLLLLTLTLVPQLRQNPLRFIILWRFYYLYRIDQSFFRVLHSKTGWYVFYTFMKMLLVFYLFCHYTGCSYYWIDYYIHKTNYYGPGQVTMMWTEYIYLWSPILAETWYLQYMYTMYYSVQTFTTIAYGDNTPKNPLQTIFVLVFLIASAVMLSYIIEEIVMLFYQFVKMRFMYMRKLKTIKRYMQYKGIEDELSDEIMRFYEYLWVEERLVKDAEQSELSMIVAKLSGSLRSKLFQQLFVRYFASIEWMLTLEHTVYEELMSSASQRIVLQGEIVVKPFEIDKCSLYLLPKKSGTYYYQYSIASAPIDIDSKNITAFGQESFFTNMPHRLGLRVLKQQVMYVLPRSKFIHIISAHNIRLWEQFQQQNHHILYSHQCNILGECVHCFSKEHSIIECPKLHFVPEISYLVSKGNWMEQPRLRQKRIPSRTAKCIEKQGFKAYQLTRPWAFLEQHIQKLELLVHSQQQLHFHADPVMEVHRQYSHYYPRHNHSQLKIFKK